MRGLRKRDSIWFALLRCKVAVNNGVGFALVKIVDAPERTKQQSGLGFVSRLRR